MRLVYSPHYSFDLGAHPFPMEKYRRVYEMLRVDGTAAEDTVLTPAPAADTELHRAHTPEYVARFRAGELTPQAERRLGFAWSPALARRALHATGGTILAARWALRRQFQKEHF